MKLGDKD